MTETAEQLPKSIWMVTREYEGIAGAGGVKDVCRQLAEALVNHGQCTVSVILPRYGFIDAPALGFQLTEIGTMDGRIGARRYAHIFEVDMHYSGEERREPVAIWQGELGGVQLYLIEADRYATKRGVYTYTEEDEQEVLWQHRGRGHFDYFAMNVLLQKTALDLIMFLGEWPDVVHCHDGHAALLPAMMKENSGYRPYFNRTGAVVTIHNAGLGYHQEVEDLDFAQAITALPRRVINDSILGNGFDPFLAASGYALLNTVSENYALELQHSPEDSRTGWLGHTLLARGISLAGITNGIDPQAFEPSRPQTLGLSHGFNIRTRELEGKRACKQAMLTQLGSVKILESIRQYGVLSGPAELPLFTFIGRLTAQKGVDIVLESLLRLLQQGEALHMLLFGSGAAELERQLELLAESEQGWGKICFLKGFHPAMANQVYAAGDFFLIPSRYEPCGLTDYIAQLMGNLPIVHRVGGLVKVVDGETGFSYSGNSPGVLAKTMQRAMTVYRSNSRAIERMQVAAVDRIDRQHTWQVVMESYMKLYYQSMQRWQNT
ncbi:MAG: glycogen synthase [Desulfobulbus sp.]